MEARKKGLARHSHSGLFEGFLYSCPGSFVEGFVGGIAMPVTTCLVPNRFPEKLDLPDTASAGRAVDVVQSNGPALASR